MVGRPALRQRKLVAPVASDTPIPRHPDPGPHFPGLTWARSRRDGPRNIVKLPDPDGAKKRLADRQCGTRGRASGPVAISHLKAKAPGPHE